MRLHTSNCETFCDGSFFFPVWSAKITYRGFSNCDVVLTAHECFVVLWSKGNSYRSHDRKHMLRYRSPSSVRKSDNLLTSFNTICGIFHCIFDSVILGSADACATTQLLSLRTRIRISSCRAFTLCVCNPRKILEVCWAVRKSWNHRTALCEISALYRSILHFLTLYSC